MILEIYICKFSLKYSSKYIIIIIILINLSHLLIRTNNNINQMIRQLSRLTIYNSYYYYPSLLSSKIYTTTTANIFNTNFSTFKHINKKHITRHHQRIRIDQLSHKFKTQQAVEQFVKQQQDRYRQYTKPCVSRVKQYFNMAYDRKDLRNTTPPERYGQYLYSTQANWYKQREYTLICRHKTTDKSGKSQVILDIMKHWPLYNYSKTIQLTKTIFSTTHKYLAFGIDLNNTEQTNFMIKDIKNNSILAIKNWQNNMLRNVDNIVFYKDQGIFYTKINSNYRPCQLYYQDLQNGEQIKLYTQNNQSYYLDIAKSKDQQKLIISANGKFDNQVWVIDLSKQQQSKNKQKINFVMKQISPRLSSNNSASKSKDNNQNKRSITMKQNNNKKLEITQQQQQTGIKACVNHSQNQYIIWNNGLLTGDEIVAISQIGGVQKIIHKIQPEQTITDIDIFTNCIVLYIKNVVTPILRVISLQNDQSTDIQLPYNIGEVTPGANQDLQTNQILIYLNNIFVYNQGYTLNLQTKKLTLSDKFVTSGPKFNVNQYQVKIHDVPSQSGQTIPLTTVIPKRNLKRRNKMILHSYGYYGLSYELSYNSTYWAALQAGWSLAFAHIRGGGEKGHKWHQSAIKQKRAVSLQDLEDCVAYLITHQYTHPAILVLSSHSAGAITIWCAINRNPHLYKAAIFSYPFLDVLSNLLDSQKALSQTDYHQLGNPLETLQMYNQIQSMSPYQTIHRDKDYPFILITAGKNDYRCTIENIAKFVTRFRRLARTKISKQAYYSHSDTSKSALGNINKINVASPLEHQYQEPFEQKKHPSELRIQTNLNLQQQDLYSKDYDNPYQHEQRQKSKKSKQFYKLNGILCKINEEASHEGIADISQQIHDGCEKLAVLDYLIEEASYDVKINTGRNIVQ